MEIGILTARFRDKSLPEMIEWAAGAGFTRMEVASKHLGLEPTKDDDAVRGALERTGLRLSSIAHYDGGCLKNPAASSASLVKAIARAVEFGTDVVCALAGLPLEGKTKEESIDAGFEAAFGPPVEEAEKQGVKIAIENWFATTFQHFELWDRALALVASDRLGLNYDPSHLEWQGIDYVAGVETYAKRIFHVHAKDVTIDHAKLERVGCLARGWWRYSIPGQGEVNWGRFVGALRAAGYDGVLSIEHEDGTFDAEAGFEVGLKYLRNFVG